MQRLLVLGCPTMRLVQRYIFRIMFLGELILYPKIFYHTEGKLIRIPGLPEMYDYEFLPQEVWPI